jgi:hypothetical protein
VAVNEPGGGGADSSRGEDFSQGVYGVPLDPERSPWGASEGARWSLLWRRWCSTGAGDTEFFPYFLFSLISKMFSTHIIFRKEKLICL